MKLLLSTLKTFLKTDASLAKICQTLTNIGFEVEDCQDYSQNLQQFTVAEIISTQPHPNSQKLQICLVKTTDQMLSIVCGATNVRAGIKVALAPIGSTIPASGLVIKKAKIAGVESNGMLCSASELQLGNDNSGIIEINNKIAIGTPISIVFNKQDALIELNITPNRGDCLGVYNIAKELYTAGIGELQPLNAVNIISNTTFPYNINNQQPQICQFIAFRQINNIKNQQAPQWLKDYLQQVGINSISAVVDILNYTMHLFNQPLHAYDSLSIADTINIKMAGDQQQFFSLKQQHHQLNSNTLIIADQQQPLSIAGIIGNLQHSCTLDTTSILLESAYFCPKNIAATGQKLAILSDARYRFERGTDWQMCAFALDFATSLILQICGGNASNTSINNNSKYSPSFSFDYNLIKQLTGIDIDREFALDTLTKLGFKIQQSTSTQWQITAPTHRHDISIAQDIVEELLRIYGYNNINSIPLPQQQQAKFLPDLPQLIRQQLINNGLIETINWSFINHKTATAFTSDINSLIELSNPISAEMQYLRPNLASCLALAYQKNCLYNLEDCSLFEIGAVYLPNQTTCQAIGILRAGKNISTNHFEPSRNFDVFDIKQDISNILDIFNLKFESLQYSNNNLPNYYHPHRSTAMFLGKNLIGYFGELHPQINQQLNINHKINIGELFYQNLPHNNLNINHKAYNAVQLPIVERDFSFLASNTVAIGDICKTIVASDKIYINKVTLIDIFSGKNIPTNQLSLTFRLKIKPTTQTLTTAEIDSISNKVIEAVKNKHQLILRNF